MKDKKMSVMEKIQGARQFSGPVAGPRPTDHIQSVSSPVDHLNPMRAEKAQNINRFLKQLCEEIESAS